MSDTVTPKYLGGLRPYLEELERRGDLQHVTEEVDPVLELGAFSRRSTEENTPLPIFENLKGFPGVRALGSVAAYSSDPRHPWARVALALGLPAQTTAHQMVDRFVELLDRRSIEPEVVSESPAQQNVITAEGVDLNAWPVPLLHDGDGGHYLNTIGVVVTRTPDGTWANWHVCRCMRLDHNRITMWTRTAQHFGAIHQMWAAIGQPMPIAIAVGASPAAVAVGAMPIPYHVDEAGVIGAWFGEPVKVVQAKSVDLRVPADAEIIFEGLLSVDEYALEGPFGEFHGYLHGSPGHQLVATITAITHRDNPIYPVVPAGKPVDDDHTLVGIGGGAEYKHALLKQGIPVARAYMVPESASQMAVVTIERDWRHSTGITDSDKLVDRVASIVLNCKNGVWISHLLVVDDDIDPANPRDVIWALASRVRPSTGRQVIDYRLVSDLPITYTPEQRERHLGPLEVLNGLIPFEEEGIRIASFDENYPADMKSRVEVTLKGSTENPG